MACLSCKTTETKSVTELLQKRWSAESVTENGTLVYSQGTAQNLKNGYSNFVLQLNRDGSASITELDGHTATGEWELSEDSNTLTLKNLNPSPSGTGGVISYTIEKVDESTLIITRISANPKTGGTLNQYILTS